MKTNKLARIAGAIAIPAAATLSGCMSDGETSVKLLEINHKRRIAVLTPQKNIDEVSEKIYDKQTKFNDNRITQETSNRILDSAFKNAYQNRQ